MPIGEIVGEVARGLLRVILVEFLFELMIEGTGYLICKRFKSSVDPDGVVVAVVGIVFWMLIGGLGYVVYRSFFA